MKMLLQLILLLFLIICISYTGYKIINYIIRIGFGSIKVLLKMFAFIVAIGIIAVVLSKL